MRRQNKRIGIYSGAFDPVHVGHVGFALQAIKAARLDQVVFMPERSPRRKRGIEHYAHRVAMLQQAIAPYPKMSVLELADKQFTVHRTLPQLQKLFGAQLVILLGSDVVSHLPNWPYYEELLKICELAVGVRGDDSFDMVHTMIQSWSVRPQSLHLFQSYSPQVSSTTIREGLARGERAEGLLTSVKRYVVAEWLYISIVHAYDQAKAHHARQ
ncbi:MAG TPA: nicotinate-nicotinamide nucleotide adenylyltransferase [Candidatus Saccharimonadales bacterium]|nr:nicotinate-nicotinamide nucleotide adenylyltransferase [Candidatus Saccharimonadales bacterium]